MGVETILGSRCYQRPRIGVFGCGLAAYWPQFPGLLERLQGYQRVFEQRLDALGAEVVSGGLVDTPTAGREVGEAFRRGGVDLLFCYMSTYTTSANVLPVVQRAGVPMVIISLQPHAAMDYARASTFMQLEHDNQTSLPEVCNALERAGLVLAGLVVGTLDDDPDAWSRIAGWVKVARAYAAVRDARLGLMGHVYEGMLDMNADPTRLEGTLGLHSEHLEMDDLQVRVDAVSETELAKKREQIHALFEMPAPGSDPIAGPAQPEDLAWSARVACGLDRLVDDSGLSGLAYYYRGLDGNAYERLGCFLIVGASLLTGRGVPVAGEWDIKNCIAMLVVDRLEAGGSFCELHPCDFTEDFVLVGHDGPHHVGVAQGRPMLRGLSLMHGKRGAGVSVEFSLRHGPITCVALAETFDGGLKIITAEGESLPGPIPATGNTNTRGRFPPDVRSFVENWSLAGPTHHFALGVGHIARLLAQFCRCYGIRYTCVTEPGYGPESAPIGR